MKKIIILAAGKGTRMKSDLPKVLHKLGNVPMLQHVIDNAKLDENAQIILVVGYGSEQVKEYFGDDVIYAYQEQQLGTGHAVMCAMDHINDDDEVIITYGDTPLISRKDFECFEEKKAEGYGALLMTSIVKDPKGYGRIITKDGLFDSIVEERDATDVQRKIQEVNVGTYIIDGALLKRCIARISNDNDQKEYYVTDVFGFAKEEAKVSTYSIDEESMLGINSKDQLSQAERILRRRINRAHMDHGVSLIDPDTTYIDKSVVIEPDCIIYPNCHLRGDTVIGKGTIIRENTTIEDGKIGSGCTIRSSTITQATVGDHTTVGPYAYLRPKTVVGEHCKIGDFVELKNAKFGNGSKASHLAYIGDAVIGENVNIGCGVVFVNYDGKNKFTTTIGDHAFVGSNVNLVAPVEIGANATLAAGSTIVQDVPENALAIARERQTNKENWKK
ncbi:MAG: bifunctional UDP-N-acetylglucosamine diphosphorylase/glucosamine-1-phosphate N-acetyltransferase GlmU [Peptostreptococcaceae bacterium]|nr:bifunctional UDP-N-acetylglucosamine diphosphorylase/glucosamine-1-phosphate N-acetyltransferase GlmU [Peptostreptococcaceae bacterium]